MLALQVTLFFDFRKTNDIKALMNIMLISCRISLYLLALRSLYFSGKLLSNTLSPYQSSTGLPVGIYKSQDFWIINPVKFFLLKCSNAIFAKILHISFVN